MEQIVRHLSSKIRAVSRCHARWITHPPLALAPPGRGVGSLKYVRQPAYFHVPLVDATSTKGGMINHMAGQRESMSDHTSANRSSSADVTPTVAVQQTAADTTRYQRALRAAADVLTATMLAQPGSATKHTDAPDLFDRLEHAIKADEHATVKEAVALAGDTKKLAVDVGQHLKVVGAEAVGVAELAGFRYSVKAYEAQVDGGLYRGSRIDDAKMAALKQQGIKAVVSLCLEHTDDAALTTKYGVAFLNVKILDNTVPKIEQMMEFINFAKAHPPTYVHCEAGVGRTGTAVACYRIVVDGWTADQAIAEAIKMGLALINQVEFIKMFAATIHGATSAAKK